MDYRPFAESLLFLSRLPGLGSSADPDWKVGQAYFDWPDLPRAPDVLVRAVRRKVRAVLLDAGVSRLSPEGAYGAVVCMTFPWWWAAASFGQSRIQVWQVMQADVLPRLRTMLGLREDGTKADGSVEVDDG